MRHKREQCEMRPNPSMQKITFSLPAEVVAELRQVVAEGVAPSENVLVREAIERELKRVRSQELRRAFAEAASDPLFMQDIAETMQAFDSSDAETARMIPAE